MNTEKAIAAALEPLVDDLLALERRFDAFVPVPGPAGDAGKDADPALVAKALANDAAFVESARGDDGGDGTDGNDGAGIDAPLWVPGAVYRKGAAVAANIGQHFRALQDTASATDDPAHWERIGCGGFRHRGAFDKDAAYVDGDLFANGFNTFVVVDGVQRLMAGRGPVGAKGDPGARGERGDAGRDGASIIAAQATGFKLVLVVQTADGVENIEADFGDAFRALAGDVVAELATQVRDLRDELAMLRRERQRVRA